MKKRWYTTVGVPGGEYAVETENQVDLAAQLIGAEHHRLMDPLTPQHYWEDVIFRPAPPDLAEWLDNVTMLSPEATQSARLKVPGGWIYYEEYQGGPCDTYVPVAGSANITIVAGDQ